MEAKVLLCFTLLFLATAAAEGDTRRCGYLIMKSCVGDTTEEKAWGFDYDKKKCVEEAVFCGTGGLPRNAFKTEDDCNALCGGYDGPQYTLQEMVNHMIEKAKKTG